MGGHHPAPHGHNSAHADHLHSHPHGDPGHDRSHEVADLCAAFVDGFREAGDKVSFLRLAGVPFELDGADGLTLKLVDVAIRTAYQVGTASPGFASRELVYMPYAGGMVRGRTELDLVYVSLTERRDVPLAQFVLGRL